MNGNGTRAGDVEAELLRRQKLEEATAAQASSSDYDVDGIRFDSQADRELVALHKKHLWEWIKKVGSSVLSEGANMTKMSLPVALFEPRSFLERLTDNWSYMDLLASASASSDPVDRMRWMVAFAVSGLSRNNSFGKPFNPILGETLQATYSSGVAVFCEQTSHHPPVSSWEVHHPAGAYTFTGTGTWSASISANSVKGHQAGTHRVQFASDGAVVTWNLPYVYVRGVLWGDRVVSYAGEMVFEDRQNGLRCAIDIGKGSGAGFSNMFGLFGGVPAKKSKAKGSATVMGTIMRVAPGGKAGKKAGAGDTIVDECDGSWLSYLEWAGGSTGAGVGARRYWDRATAVARQPAPVKEPLPSDCRFREDLVALQAGDLDRAQRAKEYLENVQRNCAKLRKTGGGIGN